MEDGNNSIFSSPCVFSKFPRLLHPEDMESQQVMLWLLGAGVAHRHLLLLQPEYFSWFLQACRSPTGARELQWCQRKHIWPLKTWSNHIFENLFPLMSVMMWHSYSKAKLLIPSIGVCGLIAEHAEVGQRCMLFSDWRIQDFPLELTAGCFSFCHLQNVKRTNYQFSFSWG